MISHMFQCTGYRADMGNSFGSMGYSLGDLGDLYRREGPWTTVQIEIGRDVQPAGPAIELRWRNVREVLEKQGAPSAHLEAVDAALGSPAQGAPGAVRYVLVGREGVVIDEVVNDSAVAPNTATFGELPVLAPLAQHDAHQLPYLLVEAGREGARLTAAQPGTGPEAVEEVSGETLHLTKVRSGGWAHRRMQQTAEEVWRRNAVEVAADVERMRRRTGARLVVLSGDVRAREQITAHLTSEALDQLVEVDVHSKPAGAADADVPDLVADRLAEIVEEERREAVERYGDGHGTGLSVSGLGQVVHALRQAQVEVLMMDRVALHGRSALALADEPWVALSPADVTGSAVLTEVDATEAIVRAGALTGAAFVPFEPDGGGSSFPGGHGVAAVLRWPVGPPAAE
jgi:Bacterial archaeo-eukaryotic release factor family 2